MFSTDPSRMYAALRCIEVELEKPRPSIKRIRGIMAEAGRELRPTKYAPDLLPAPACCASFVAHGVHHRDCRLAQPAGR